MDHLNILTFFMVFLTLNIANNEVNSQQVSISVYNTSSNNNVLAGLTGNLYVEIPDQSSFFVSITCTKTSSFQGTLYLTINTEPINNGQCTQYIANNQQTDFNCLSKTYSVDITSLNSYNSYINRIPIFCRINEDSSKYSVVDLIRLYTDNKSRVRKGLILYDSMNTFDVYDQISCEAIADSRNGITFDNVQWYTTNLQGSFVNFNLPSQINKITSTITNYSIAFKLTASNQYLYSGNNNIKCCTTSGSTPITTSCVDVIIQGNLSTTAAPQTTPTTSTSTSTTSAPTTVSTTKTSVVTTSSSTKATMIASNTTLNSTALPMVTTTAKTGLTSDEIGIIVGSIVGAIVLGALILLGLCCYCNYLRQGKSSSATFNINNNQQATNTATITRTPSQPKTQTNNKPTKKSEKDKTKISQNSAHLPFSYLPDVKNQKTIKKVNEDSVFINAFD